MSGCAMIVVAQAIFSLGLSVNPFALWYRRGVVVAFNRVMSGFVKSF